MVAKSYQAYEILTEPYVKNGRKYVDINYKNKTKTVRWYSDAEYAKLYPAATTPVAPTVDLRDILGFQKGYITIFKGPVEEYEEYFNASPMRYHKLWGWYLVSTDELPPDIPSNIFPQTLSWESVGNTDGSLKPEAEVRKAVDSILYDSSPSQYVGNIGDRITVDLKILSAIPNETKYGTSTFHVMEDKDGNQYVWNSSSKTLQVNNFYTLRGTIKGYDTYKGIKQTILTRCVKED